MMHLIRCLAIDLLRLNKTLYPCLLALMGEFTTISIPTSVMLIARHRGRSSPMALKQNPVQLTSDDPWDFDFLSSTTPIPSASTSAIPSPALAPQQDDFELAFDQPVRNTGKSPLASNTFDAPSKTDDFELAFDSPPPTSRPSPKVHLAAEDDYTSLDQEAIKRQAADLLNTYSAQKPKSSKARSSSPPPHVLGRLVELGFGIPEARQALLKTYADGWNVEAAADSLLSGNQVGEEREEVLPARPERRRTPDTRLPETREGKEDYLAQASVLGNTLFKQANAYWKTGKKVVSKAIEEQRSTTPKDGRPRWMQDTPVDEPQASTSSFRDEDDVPSPKIQTSRPVSRSTTPSAPPQPKQAPVERKVYQSSARRAVPQRTADSPKPAPLPKPTFTRPSIACSSTALQQSTSHREKGNEHFKLGAYGEAESCYTSALQVLPEGHLSRITILNNRANARLKNGNERSAVEDASTAIDLICCGRAMGEVEPEMKDSLGKALGRRAKGLEACEKWIEASRDYEVLLGGGEGLVRPAGGMSVISAGLARCKKALAPKPARPVKKPTPKVQAAPSGEAVKELRKTAVLAEKDEATKDALKDSVDERVMAWKGGKEANIRALVASLETVLWPELEWKKVGMHELISEGQLKVRYMRAIGKLHPDKVRLLFPPLVLC